MSPERHDTVVIGAGQAGLAAAYHLARHERDFVVLDAAQRIGQSWRDRWDSLRLFTPGYMNDLPGLPFPGEPRRAFPGKDEAASYLEDYATRFSLPVRLGVAVDRLTRKGDRYLITAGSQELEADHVVVATGPYQKPRIPAFAGELAPSITQLHSSAYRNPGQLAAGDVLVVGAATSGSQIAMDVVAGRRVYLSGPSVGKVPRKLVRLIFPWIARRPQRSFIGKRLHKKARSGGHPLIGFTYRDVTRTGVERVPRTTGVTDGRPQLEDGRSLDVANVIWATGYSVDFSWIELPIFGPDGYPRHTRGVAPEAPGLYFVGLIFQHSLSSALIQGAGRDAAFVVDDLVGRRQVKSLPATGEPRAAAAAGQGN